MNRRERVLAVLVIVLVALLALAWRELASIISEGDVEDAGVRIAR